MTRRIIGTSALSALTLTLPALASAQTLFSVLGIFSSLINIVIYLLIGVAIIAFFWGLVQYLFSGGEEKSKGLQTMLWGVVAIFVMVSIWGLIRLLQSTFGTTSTTPIVPQTIQVNTGV